MSERSERKKRIRRERRRERRRQRSFKKTMSCIFGWIITAIVGVVIGYGVVVFGWQTVYMVGDSMKPSIEAGESVVINKFCYYLGSVERYDVVAYKDIDDSESYYTIKRVIGLPGETVQIVDGYVYIDGKKLTDLPFDDYIFTAGVAENEVTLGDDEYFLLGDNVNNSEDSRYLTVGNISKSVIVGRVKM